MTTRLKYVVGFVKVAIFSCLFVSDVLYATQYQVLSSFLVKVENNDNVLLDATTPEETTLFLTKPSVDFKVSEKDWDISVSANASKYTYSNSSLNRTSGIIDFQSSLNNQRSSYVFNSKYTLNSSLDQDSNDIGPTSEIIEKRTITLGPQYVHSFTRKLSLNLGLNHTDVSYLKTAATSNFRPSITSSISSSLSYRSSEIDTLSATFRITDYKSKNNVIKNKLYFTSLAIQHQFSATFNSNFSLGLSNSESTIASGNSFVILGVLITQAPSITSTSGLVANFNISKSMELNDITLALSQDIKENSSGVITQSNTVSFQLSHKFSKRLSARFSGNYSENESVTNTNTFTDNILLTYGLNVNYKLAKDWSVNGSYKYTERELLDPLTAEVGKSNRMYLEIVYKLPQISTF